MTDFNLLDYGQTLSLVYSNNPDCVVAAELLEDSADNILLVDTQEMPFNNHSALIGDQDIQVFFNVVPKFCELSKFNRLICVYTDPTLFAQVRDSIREPRDLDKYGACCICYTPYSMVEFVLNRFESAVTQALKGIVCLPYLDEIDAHSDLSLELYDYMSMEDVGLLESPITAPQIANQVRLDYLIYADSIFKEPKDGYLIPQFCFVNMLSRREGTWIIKSTSRFFLATSKDGKASIQEITPDLVKEKPELKDYISI